jgi:3-hydroxyacyl-CoA dehydrogenase
MIRTLFLNRGKASRDDFSGRPGVDELRRRCADAYLRQVELLLSEGVSPVLIENAAFAAGFASGSLAVPKGQAITFESGTGSVDIAMLKQRLLCSQALAAAECWEEGLTDPVTADVASTLLWRFPSYTGGVFSYIDTMGLNAFISLCNSLSTRTGAGLNPTPWLRAKAQESDRIYLSMA